MSQTDTDVGKKQTPSTPIPEQYRDLVEQPLLLNLGTIMPDGSPQVTPVWFDYDGSYIRVNSALGRVKDRNMRARPTVAGCIVDPQNIYRHLAFQGVVVEITEEGARDHINALSRRYGGQDYPVYPNETRVTYVIHIDSVATMG